MVNTRLKFGGFVLEPALQRLTRDGDIVPLKPKAWDLLCLLLENRDRVLSKEELLDWLWPRQEIYESNLVQTVYELRRALGDSGRKARWIKNVPRRGYHFSGIVEEISGPGGRKSYRSIAVLPFRHLSDDPPNPHTGLGLADSVITTLSGAGRLVVRPTSTILRYAHTDRDAIEIGRDLKVETVLEGTLQEAGDRTRANVRLLSTNDGRALWAGEFTEPDSPAFRIQDRISARVAEAVSSRLDCSDRRRSTVGHGRMRTENPQVHTLYMQGLYCWHRWNTDSWHRAAEYFQQAIDLDERHAPSHAWLGSTFTTLGIFGALPPREAFARARTAARQAVELDPTRSEGHETQGAIHLFFDWDLAAAADSLDRAIELDPDSCNARHLRALTLAIGGHYGPARSELRKALHADPQSLITHADIGAVDYWARRFLPALNAIRQTVRLDPNFTHARIALALCLLEVDQPREAVAQMNRALEQLGHNPAYLGHGAYVLARGGESQAAMRLTRQLETNRGRHYVDPFQLALAWLGLGDHDKAFDWLEQSLANRSRDMVLLPVNPVMDPLRDDPRFAQLLKRCGLDPKVESSVNSVKNQPVTGR